MMAFVDDHLAVFSHDVLHLALSNQTLNDCYIESPGLRVLPTSHLTDILDGETEEQRQSLPPLVH